MRVKILGKPNTRAYNEAIKLITHLGLEIVEDYPDIAIAPMLDRIIDSDALARPLLGTLIFHPSPLPYGRGASAIRHAYRRKEAITAATWFWADEGVDTGDICEQEIVKIDYNLRPKEFYEVDIIPAMIRTLKRALNDISNGHVRKVPQIHRYSSFDYRL